MKTWNEKIAKNQQKKKSSINQRYKSTSTLNMTQHHQLYQGQDHEKDS